METESVEFRFKLSVSIANSIPFFFFGIPLIFCAIFWLPVFLLLPVPFLIGIFAFLESHLTKVVVDEEEISWRSLLWMKKVRWEKIANVKLSYLSPFALTIYRGQKESKFWTLKPARRNYLRITNGLCSFKELLKIVITKSVNAKIDPLVYQFLQVPGTEKIRRTRRVFSVSSIFILGILVWLMAEFGFNKHDGLGYLLGFKMLALVFVLIGYLFSLVLYRWDGEKWLWWGNILGSLVFVFSCFFIIWMFSGFYFQFVISAMLGFISIVLFTFILTLFPNLNVKQLPAIFLVLCLVVIKGGESFFINPQVKTHTFKRIDNFIIDSMGWFPDESKIYVAGWESTCKKYEDEWKKILIFDTGSKKLISSMSTKGTYLSSSFAWSPDGTKLTLIEYLEDKNCSLFLLDTKSLQKELILNGKSISFIKYGCWNPDGTKLAGRIAGEEDKMMAFLIDVDTKKLSIFQEENGIQSAFWFPDGNIGILHYKNEGVEKEKLFKYSITRINIDTLKEELVYSAKEHYKWAQISPHGNFLLARGQENNLLIIDVFRGSQELIEGKIAGCRAQGYWSLDETSVLFPLGDGNREMLTLYKPISKRLIKILPQLKENLKFVNWSGDSQRFLATIDGFFSDNFLISNDGEKVMKLWKGGLLDSFAPFEWAGLNYNGSRVIYSTQRISFSRNKFPSPFNDDGIGVSISTTLFLAEINKD